MKEKNYNIHGVYMTAQEIADCLEIKKKSLFTLSSGRNITVEEYAKNNGLDSRETVMTKLAERHQRMIDRCVEGVKDDADTENETENIGITEPEADDTEEFDTEETDEFETDESEADHGEARIEPKEEAPEILIPAEPAKANPPLISDIEMLRILNRAYSALTEYKDKLLLSMSGMTNYDFDKEMLKGMTEQIADYRLRVYGYLVDWDAVAGR